MPEANEQWIEDLKNEIRKAQSLNLKDRILTHQQLIDADIPMPSWIINMMIPNPGLVALSGKPGSYKTFLAIWLGQRIAAGLQPFDHYEEKFFIEALANEPMGVLFIEEEMSERQVKSRITNMMVYAPDNMHWLIGANVNMKSRNDVEEIAEYMVAKNLQILILDPFTSVMKLKDENSNAEVATVMDILRKCFVDKGMTVIFLHHPSKSDTSGLTLRGAGDILGKVDVHLSLEKLEDENSIKVSYEKGRDIDLSKVSDFLIQMVESSDPMNFGRLEWHYIGKALPKNERKQNKELQTILDNTEIGKEYSKNELAASIDHSHNDKQWRAVLFRLINDGYFMDQGHKKPLKRLR